MGLQCLVRGQQSVSPTERQSAHRWAVSAPRPFAFFAFQIASLSDWRPQPVLLHPGSEIWNANNRAAVGRNQTSATNRAVSQPVDCARDTDHQAPRHVRNQASKQAFQHGETGRATERHGEAQSGASRGVRLVYARSAIPCFPVALCGFPCFSVLKNLLAFLWDQHAGPVIDVSRLAATKRYASRRAPALGAVLAEAPANQCYRHLSGNSSRAAVIWQVSSAVRGWSAEFLRCAGGDRRVLAERLEPRGQFWPRLPPRLLRKAEIQIA